MPIDISQLQPVRQIAAQVCQSDQTQPKRFVDFGYPLLNQATLGLDSGVFLFSAPPNMGKSAMLLNIAYQIITNNDNVYVLDFSLDDSKEDRVRSSIARVAKMPINWVKLPNSDEVNDDARKQRLITYNQWVTTISRKLQIIDETDFEGNANHLSIIREVIYTYRSKLPDTMKLVVTLDGFHNVVVDDMSGDDYAKQMYLSAEIKNIAANSKSIIIASTHTPKGSMKRGLTQDAVKGAGGVTYDAKIIGTIFSDYKVNRNNAEIYHEHELAHLPGTRKRMPVIELDITKNKSASFSEIIFYWFFPEYAYVEEAPEQWQTLYRRTIYGDL